MVDKLQAHTDVYSVINTSTLYVGSLLARMDFPRIRICALAVTVGRDKTQTTPILKKKNSPTLKPTLMPNSLSLANNHQTPRLAMMPTKTLIKVKLEETNSNLPLSPMFDNGNETTAEFKLQQALRPFGKQ